MEHHQPLRDVPSVSDSQRAVKTGAVTSARSVSLRTQPAYGGDVRGQTSNQPTSSYSPEYPPLWVTRNLDSYLFEGRGSRYGPTSLCPPSSAAYPDSRDPTGGARDVWNALDGRQGPRSSVTQVPCDVAGPSGAISRAMVPPEGEGQYPYTDIRGPGPHEQPDLGGPELSHTPHGIWNRSIYVHSAPPRFDSCASTSGSGPYENQLLTEDRRVISVLPPTRFGNPGIGSRPTMVHNAFSSGRPPTEARSDHHNPHADVRPYHTRQWAESTLTSAGPSGERTDVLGRAESLDFHNHGGGMLEGMEYPMELPPGHRSDGLLNQPTGIRSRGNGGKVTQAMGPDKASPAKKRTGRGKPGGLQDSTVALPVTPAIICSSAHAVLIPQTPYEPVARQSEWFRQAPIKFGGVKLADAADPGYSGMHGYGDKVLNYKGVGSSILCRLILNGREIDSLKIVTTNHKKNRESITKKKLAFEIAKLVRRCVEEIKVETGYHDIVFENIVLTGLFHASRASWQPELWCEFQASNSASS